MRHYPDIHAETPRQTRIKRLFALHHQQTSQAQFAAADPGPVRLSQNVIAQLRDRAVASFDHAQQNAAR